MEAGIGMNSKQPSRIESRFVGQGDYVLNTKGSVVTTGLGPCIGVVVIYKRLVFMMHVHGAHASHTAEEFFAKMASSVPVKSRMGITPRLAGGCNLGKSSEVLISRKWIRDQLKLLGFGKPNARWCPRNKVQSVEVFEGRVKIKTKAIKFARR
jgi:hypothetical protein